MERSPLLPLKDREGEVIFAFIPIIHPTTLQEVRLLLVEDAGIWIESQQANTQMLKHLRVSSSMKTAVFFLPWHQLAMILDSIDVPSVSESSLGL
jgi:hypothetical protein